MTAFVPELLASVPVERAIASRLADRVGFIARFSRGRSRPGLFADVRTARPTCRDGSQSSVRGRPQRTYKQEVVGSIPAAPTDRFTSGIDNGRPVAQCSVRR
jgi:hypothetical protein